ncbi:biotin/lipoyl-binding protein [Pelagibacteraceae bacterium]|nr:biotin/lipoyl-binding protein [Pelagibacteraceae bacterium]
MAQNISVPDIGDFDSVEIIEILVNVGDQIKKNDAIVTLESDKSSVEVPSPFDGKILELNVKVGDKVSKGSLLVKLENGSSVRNEKEEVSKNISPKKKRNCRKKRNRKH